MNPQTVPDVQRLFIGDHLHLEVDGLCKASKELGEPEPPSYIGIPVAGPKGFPVLRFHLVGSDSRGWRYEYRYTGKGVVR